MYGIQTFERFNFRRKVLSADGKSFILPGSGEQYKVKSSGDAQKYLNELNLNSEACVVNYI